MGSTGGHGWGMHMVHAECVLWTDAMQAGHDAASPTHVQHVEDELCKGSPVNHSCKQAPGWGLLHAPAPMLAQGPAWLKPSNSDCTPHLLHT